MITVNLIYNIGLPLVSDQQRIIMTAAASQLLCLGTDNQWDAFWDSLLLLATNSIMWQELIAIQVIIIFYLVLVYIITDI